MPFKYRCTKCGEVLYRSDLLKSPEDLIMSYEGKCPRCKADLQKPKPSTGDVTINPVAGTYVPSTGVKPPGRPAKNRR